MAKTTIAVDIDEAANIALDFSSKVAFHLIVAVEDFAKVSDFLLGQISDSFGGINARLFDDLVDIVLADSIEEGQSVDDRFISG